MKVILNYVLAILVVGAISCNKENPVPEPEKTVDYKLVDSLLSARGRYWVIEKITKVTGDEKLEYISDNNFKNDSLLGIFWHGAIIASVNFKFYDGGNITQKIGGGPFGPLPFTTTGKFNVYHLSERKGGYSWAKDYSKVNVVIPSPLQSILQHISKVDPGNFVGYLDPSSYPVYGNVEEIKAAGKSERIKIIMDPKNTDCKASYIFTLRAVWLDSSGYGGSRQSIYNKVIY